MEVYPFFFFFFFRHIDLILICSFFLPFFNSSLKKEEAYFGDSRKCENVHSRHYYSAEIVLWVIFHSEHSISSLFQILVHVGFLTEESGDVFSPKVLKGGPLGEMVQWADILTTLHVLGHNLKISLSVKELQGWVVSPVMLPHQYS